MPSRTSTAAVLLEAVAVVAAGAVFALAVNQISKRGLQLTRDYFPGVASAAPAPAKFSPPAATNAASTAPTNQDSEEAETNQRIKEKGLQPISRPETERLFHDPRYQQGLVIFVDARTEDHYAESHIPGAYPLDYYHPDKDLSAVLTPCQNADQVIVYCTGGECEDAENTALFLSKAGVPAQKIFVYGGGFEDWSANHLPLEQGARNSGLAPAESK